MSTPEVTSACRLVRSASPGNLWLAWGGRCSRLGRLRWRSSRGARGLSDVLWLVPLRLLTGETTTFVRDDSRSLLLGLLQALSIDLWGIFLGGIVMSLILKGGAVATRSGLTADVTALAGWPGCVCADAGCSGLRGAAVRPARRCCKGISYAALTAWGLHWLVSLLTLRRCPCAGDRRGATTEDDLAAHAEVENSPTSGVARASRLHWGRAVLGCALRAGHL